AEGRSNAGVARQLSVTEGTVAKHVRSILTKLGLHDTDDTHRRVVAVLTFLDAAQSRPRRARCVTARPCACIAGGSGSLAPKAPTFSRPERIDGSHRLRAVARDTDDADPLTDQSLLRGHEETRVSHPR